MNKHKRIIIVGHPGAGKGMLAKAIAEKLGWQFIDADLGLESRIGRTVLQIAGKSGAAALYDCEHEILTSLLTRENIVVTTDASIVCSEKNCQLLIKEFVVYLKVSLLVQLQRNSRNPAPLLAMTTNPEDFMEKLHQERDSLYEQVATLSINSDDGKLENHVMKVTNIIHGNDGVSSVSRQANLDKDDLVFFHKKLHTPVHLTHQQAMCLKFLAQGKSSKEIAKEMHLSHRTIDDHVANIMELLGCSSSKELIALYYDQP